MLEESERLRIEAFGIPATQIFATTLNHFELVGPISNTIRVRSPNASYPDCTIANLLIAQAPLNPT